MKTRVPTVVLTKEGRPGGTGKEVSPTVENLVKDTEDKKEENGALDKKERGRWGRVCVDLPETKGRDEGGF